MEFIKPGDIVEGAHCDVAARRLDWKGLKKDPITNELMTLYVLDRNCSVEVTKEMVFTDDADAQLRKDLNVHLQLGDKIRAEKSHLYVKSIKNDVSFEVKEGVTSTHGAHLANVPKRTIGIIQYALKAHINLFFNSNESTKKKGLKK